MIVERNVLKNTNIIEFLKDLYLPKKLINDLINQKRISVSGNIVNANSSVLKDDVVVFDLNNFDLNDDLPYKKKLNIVYEDEDIILVNKEKGILIHPDGNSCETLINALSFYFGGGHKIRCAHRIDVETTGLVLFCKNIISYHYINKQMEDMKIKKTYLAICEGYLSNDEGEINYPIGSDRHHNNRYVVSKSGKNAFTSYKVIRKNRHKSLVKVEIKTGRTHQIRVHFAYINHPLCGDKIYGQGNELMLHSYSLGFIHPKTYKWMEIKQENENYKL